MTERFESADETLRSLARALAPYLAEELDRIGELRREALDPGYNERTCRRFVGELGDEVLRRATVLFAALDANGIVDSVGLATALAITPRELSGHLTTPLKRRAKALGLPLPFAGGLGTETYGGIKNPAPDLDPERTHWQDRDGVAKRMLVAIDEELESRASSNSPA